MEIDGKVIVITGGSTGIGRAVAALFAEHGARLVLASRRADRLDETVSALRERGASVIGVPTDVADMAQVEHLAAVAFDECGGVDVVLLNAGIAGLDSLLDPDLEDWKRAIDTNVFGLLHGLKAFMPRLVAQGTPCSVLATTSGAGIHGTAYITGSYTTTKSAILSTMECLYGQVRAAGLPIHVGVVLPPLTRTNLVGDDLSMWDMVEASMTTIEHAPSLIEPEQFAPVILDGIRAERFWIEATPADDERYMGGHNAASIEHSRRMIAAKADAMIDHRPPDSYLW